MEKSSRLCLSNIWCFCMESGPGLTLSSYRKGEGSTRPSARCMISINVPQPSESILSIFSLEKKQLFCSVSRWGEAGCFSAPCMP